MAPTQPTAPQQCFKNYFLGNKIPQGLWNTANPSLRFICQTLGTTPGTDYYATLFDDTAGIAILSAYTVTATQAKKINSVQRPSGNWRQTSGLSNQGNDALYYKNAAKADKGHLNPVQINSFDQDHAKATFTYSNAVPQYLGFNRGEWKKFEGRIVNYVRTNCAAKTPTGGEMYLMTGTSHFRLQIGAATPTQDPKSPPNPLFGNAIEFPNSMWTAGCCVWNIGKTINYESIAVMGNNDPNKANTGTVSMTTLGVLEKILVATGQPAADLFPASKGGCRANSQQI